MIKHEYRKDIDGLRALAVCSVIGFHAFPHWVKGGYVGVDVFFVISGYLITRIIAESIQDSGFSFANFYARRIKRIFPALIAVCVFVFVVGWIVLLPDEFQQLGWHLFGGATFTSNIILWLESGYFDTEAELKPLLHLWSLAIEEQFYIIWPIALIVLWKRKSMANATLAAFFLFSILISSWHVNTDRTIAFYSPISRVWELMIGGTLALVKIKTTYERTTFLIEKTALISVVGLLMILFSVFWYSTNTPFPGASALLPTLGTALIIYAGPRAIVNRYLLSNSPIVWIGLISYPLYLWHWPVLVLPKLIQGRVLVASERIGLVIVAVVMAHITYKWIERPLRRSLSIWTVPALVGCVIGIGGVGLLAYTELVKSRLEHQGLEKILLAAYDWKYPPPTSAQGRAVDLRYFILEGSKLSKTLFLGDSNMEQYSSRIESLINNDTQKELNGAVFVGNQRPCELLKFMMKGDENCQDEFNALEELLQNKEITTVVLAARWIDFESNLKTQFYSQRFERLIRELVGSRRLFIILSTPTGQELSPKSMFEGSRLGDIRSKRVDEIEFDIKTFETRIMPIHDILTRMATRLPAQVIDPIQFLCPDRRCPVFDESGVPLYKDHAHLTKSYATREAYYIDQTLKDQ